MKHLTLSGLLTVASVAPITADTLQREFYDLTRDLCGQSLEGSFTAFDASDFATKIDAVGWERSEFCHCVGEGYAADGDRELLSDIKAELRKNDTFFSLNFTMFDHMTQCLPAAAQEGLGIDLGLSEAELSADLFTASDADVTDGDLVDIDELALDESDVFMCQAGLSGDMPMPGAEALIARVQAQKADAEPLCGCAALEIAKQGPDLQTAIAQASNPSVAYGSALVTAIETCLGE